MNHFTHTYKKRDGRAFPLINHFVIWLSLSISVFGCKKFVEIDPPQTKIVASTVFDNSSTATAALTVIYAKMINQNTMSYFIPLFTGLSSDELKNYSTQADLIPFYTNSLGPLNGIVQANLWTPAYSYIYQCNAVIAGLQSSSINDKIKQQLTGEALFTRAFWNFYLVNLFGDLPLAITTDYSTNALLSRASETDVYHQIVSDLVNAKGLLSASFVDASDTAVTIDRVRPTKWAASALLARVYLYGKDYGNARDEATVVINKSDLFGLTLNLAGVFLKNSTESIWQIQPVQANKNTPEGLNFILTGPPASNVYNCTTISDTLFNSFEVNDNRKVAWISNLSGYNFPFKYRAGGSATSTSEYSTVLRLAEQYLIRSEAKNMLNDLQGALEDLNMIRRRAGLNDTSATNQADLSKLILHERQVELFCEWGHRWLDLKRTMNVDNVMNGIAPIKGGNWKSDWQLYPIPQQERQNDPNLTQNNGY